MIARGGTVLGTLAIDVPNLGGRAIRIGTAIPAVPLTEEQRWQAAFPDPDLLAWTTLARSLEGATP